MEPTSESGFASFWFRRDCCPRFVLPLLSEIEFARANSPHDADNPFPFEPPRNQRNRTTDTSNRLEMMIAQDDYT